MGAVSIPVTPGRDGHRGETPATGEHTREVLRELGLDDSAIQALIDDGVLGAA